MKATSDVGVRPRVQALSKVLAELLRGSSILAVSGGTVLGVLGTGGFSTAYAQAESEAELAAKPADEEIIVTGTRIRRSDFTSANSTVSLNSDDFANLGVSTVSEMVDQLTSNVSNWNPDTTGGQAFNIGASLANVRGMNTFFGTRTLTLVDSRRFVATNNGGAVDLNVIPSAMVGRMESVTGGGSATYGSDAISGVVNIILDKELEGVKITSDFGATGEGDGDNYSVSIAGGTKILNERGHIVVSYEKQENDPIYDCVAARDWCAKNRQLYSNGASPFATPLSVVAAPLYPGEPGLLVLDGIRYSSSPNATLFTNTDSPTNPAPDLPWYEFNEAGTDVRAWDPGQFAYRGAASSVVGGQGRGVYDRSVMRPDQDIDSLYAHFQYDLGERTQFFTDVSVSSNVARSIQGTPGGTALTTYCIEASNAFLLGLPANTQTLFAQRRPDQGGACSPATGTEPQITPVGPAKVGTTISKDWVNQILRTVDTDTETDRIVLGASGKLFDKWNWDTYFQYGTTDRSQIADDYETNNRIAMAVDAIRDGGQPGNPIVCRVNAVGGAVDANGIPLPAAVAGPTGPEVRAMWAQFYGPDWAAQYLGALAPGCVPMNIFGQAASQAALDYAFAPLTEFNTIRQRVWSTTFSGALAEGWAGPIQLATGVDYRYDFTENFAGDLPTPLRTDFSLQYGDPWAGATEGYEVFVELDVPVMANRAGARYMMFNLAAREASYDVSNKDGRGGAYEQEPDSWKASFVWDPADFIRVRATRSSDVRAPSMRELFYRQTTSPGGFFGGSNVTNPWVAAYNDATGSAFITRDTGISLIGASPALENEIAITETFGLVLSPDKLERLQVSVDYFDTTLKGGISGGGGQRTVDGCYQTGDPLYCSKLTFGPLDPAGAPIAENNILQWESLQYNQQPYTTSGFDLSAIYSFDLPGTGSLSMRLIGTRTNEQDVEVGFAGARRNVAGQTGTSTEFLPNFSPAPEWQGNMFWTYSKAAFSFTAQARYTGKGLLNATTPYVDPTSPDWAQNAPPPTRVSTLWDNTLPSWTVWNLNMQYNLTGRGNFTRFEELSMSFSIENAGDKQPILSSGGAFSWGNVGGVNATFFDTLGRRFQVGMNMQF